MQINAILISRVAVFVIYHSPVALTALLNHQGTTSVPSPFHAKTRIATARAKPGTSYSARGNVACTMENFETIEYLKWNFQHFEKAKYLISQFAKKGRHDQNYRLPVGQTLFLKKT